MVYLPGLCLNDLVAGANALRPTDYQGLPRLCADASGMMLRYGSIETVKNVITELCSAGFLITVVFDPTHRHHSKCASIERTGNREAARIGAFHARGEVMKVNLALREGSWTEDERNEKTGDLAASL